MQAGNAFKDRYPYLGNKLIQRILKKKKRKEKKNKVRNKKEIERLTRNNKQLHEVFFGESNRLGVLCHEDSCAHFVKESRCARGNYIGISFAIIQNN